MQDVTAQKARNKDLVVGREWHPEDIKAALRKRGLTLAAVSVDAGLCEDACRQALRRPWPRAERAIAGRLGVPVEQLWPDRYGSGKLRSVPIRRKVRTRRQNGRKAA